MTSTVDITNRALQAMGSRTTVASLSENSNEAIQANLVISELRNQLLRMAPWNCARNYANLTLITATPGTPENTSSGTTIWQKGIPAPPWAYEYQYPVDCLRELFVVPQFTTGFASGVPITTAVTGGAPAFWLGPPQRFQISVDQFFSVSSAAVVAGGTGYALNDVITTGGVSTGSTTPVGAGAQLLVTGIGGGGAVTSVSVVDVVISDATQGGSYFGIPTNPVSQASTTGSGSGATFNLTFNTGQSDQRVILTNQENAMICYVKQVTDPNVMDPQLQEAWVAVLAARLAYQLSGDKNLANMKTAEANALIAEARKTDGNEGLTVNDVTPDWVRTRGIYYPIWELSPNIQYDWGPMFSAY